MSIFLKMVRSIQLPMEKPRSVVLVVCSPIIYSGMVIKVGKLGVAKKRIRGADQFAQAEKRGCYMTLLGWRSCIE